MWTEWSGSWLRLWKNVLDHDHLVKELGDEFEFVYQATESMWQRMRGVFHPVVKIGVMMAPADLVKFDCGCQFAFTATTRSLMPPQDRSAEEYAEYLADMFEREFANDIFSSEQQVVGCAWAPYWLLSCGPGVVRGGRTTNRGWYTRCGKFLHTKDQCHGE